MPALRARPIQLLLFFAIAALVFYSYRARDHASFAPAPSPGPSAHTDQDDLNTHARANTTLGFGAILAVSRDGSPRRHALMQAANVTEIDITIPRQPKYGDADIEKFKYGPESTMGPGSILAWLGHHNALKWFLDSGLETALIIEDDVDWDIHLRSLQVPLAAHAARSLLAPASTSRGMNYYWGDPNTWDLLYIGHCGDYFQGLDQGVGVGHQSPADLQDMPHEMWLDHSLPTNENLHPFTADLLKALEVPEQNRLFHRSRFPLCTFAYAVTRPAAWKIMNVLAPAKEPPPDTRDAPRAYDVGILQSCMRGYSSSVDKVGAEGLKCYTVNPEFFHHMPGDSEIANEEAKKGNKVGIPPVDMAGADQVTQRGETSNIGCGFWHGHFAFADGNKKQLDSLRQNVGRGGKCLKPGRDLPNNS
ncbi:hypothetical protein EJ05DRAFT_327333 [Pseudovirgaria hyperparasitica]|uniref:Glycosyltransferase family 25 protein n=1 Tax=Pseudovirgaria hyperparasitica TaxID=470096 RepID=A0A6A6W7W9_9PEZI|nr:uncharacterized protein EJ05DRAFT_327333 [Pseudovirgaria hyperparasitica]KAF2758952.1 hypothetical protein EJ05DRAFT_327333 [Pseudovirgaria hyperparasitica]